MPHGALKITNGVTQNETPALNAGLSSTQLIRLKPDPQGLTLPEKLGGWAPYWGQQISSTQPASGTIEALWAWEDTNAGKWLAAGSANNSAGQATLSVMNGVLNPSTGITQASFIQTLTPTVSADSVPVSVSAIQGNTFFTITDATVGLITSSDSVFITIPISVGGVILYGMYPCISSTSTEYIIQATNQLGNPLAAVYTTTAGITVTGGSASGSAITLTYSAISSAEVAPAGEAITVAGVSPSGWNGTYVITSMTTTQVVYASTAGAASWSSGGTISNQGITPRFTTQGSGGAYSNVVTVTLPDHGYQVGSTFPVLVQTTVGGINLVGNYLVLSVPNSYQFTIQGAQSSSVIVSAYENGVPISGGSSTSSHVTLTWLAQYTFEPSVSDTIEVIGIDPSSWNGNFTVTGATPTSVTYALAGSALSWISGGTVSDDSAPPYEYFIYSFSPNIGLIGGGYGTGGYGAGGYGTGSMTNAAAAGTPISATNWTLDNWGSQLVACAINYFPIGLPPGNNPAVTVQSNGVQFQPIYIWDPTAHVMQAVVIPQSPVVNAGAFVAMPQRQIVAYGSTVTGDFDPLLVRWCDVNNYNVWIGTVTNQAGEYRIPRGSAVIGGLQGPQQGLLWTDLAVWAMQYIGPPYIYSFNELGRGCGLIAQKAAGFLNGICYWMGQSQFFTLSGNGVQPLVCPIWDVIFQDMDLDDAANVIIAINSNFQEVAWYYPQVSNNGTPLDGIPTGYVRYNSVLNAWDYGTLDRTAWIDQSVLGPPIGANASFFVQQHEISPDAAGTPIVWSYTTGYFALSEGDQKVFVDQIWPDFKWGTYAQNLNGTANATVNISFNSADYPSETPYVDGPYTVTNQTTFITPRIRTRLLSFTVSGDDLGSFSRLGTIRYRFQSDGKF